MVFSDFTTFVFSPRLYNVHQKRTKMMNTVENQQYYIYNPYIEELNKSQSIGTQLPSMASEFLNPNVKARPRCSISPINTTDLIEASNLSVCNPSLVISDSSASCSNDSGFQSSILAPSVSFNSSPYLYPTAPIPYSLPKPTAKYYSSSTPARPTPQRKAVNFHNITDLATSSDSSCSLSGNSTSSSVDESNASTCQLNEQLKQISQSFNIINKENFEPVEVSRLFYYTI